MYSESSSDDEAFGVGKSISFCPCHPATRSHIPSTSVPVLQVLCRSVLCQILAKESSTEGLFSNLANGVQGAEVERNVCSSCTGKRAQYPDRKKEAVIDD